MQCLLGNKSTKKGLEKIEKNAALDEDGDRGQSRGVPTAFCAG